MKTYKIILNPTSNMGAGKDRVGEITALLGQLQVDYDLVFTERRDHARELAEAACADGYEAVIACGGDGTVNEVINGLMNVKDRGGRVAGFGVLPIGRGNDFAYSAGIPAGLEDACRLLAGGAHRIALDVGKVTGGFFPDGRYFVNGMGAGFDTIVGLVAAKMKHLRGFFAYIVSAVKTLINFPVAPRIVIEYNGLVREQCTTQLSIMNGRRLGGVFFMAPHARIADGKFDLLLADALNRREFLAMITSILKGEPVVHPKIVLDLVERVHISAPDGGLVGHADGETVCTDGRELTVECLPAQLSMIAGSSF